jgi:hypothetical protein
MYILAHHYAILLLLQYLLDRVGQPNTLSLRTIVRFNNIPAFSFGLLSLFSEYADFVGQNESLWVEVVLAWEAMLHFG